MESGFLQLFCIRKVLRAEEECVPGSELVEVGEEREVDHGEAHISQHGGPQAFVQTKYSLNSTVGNHFLVPVPS